MNVHFSSKTDRWETPQQLFNELDDEFHFELDVCADDGNTKCQRWWSKEEDGLQMEWMTGYWNWMNPPYGREIGKWVKRAYENGWTVALLPARTDTRWWHDYIQDKAEVRFIKGRLKFGGSKNSAPFPSCVVVFRSAHN